MKSEKGHEEDFQNEFVSGKGEMKCNTAFVYKESYLRTIFAIVLMVSSSFRDSGMTFSTN